MFVRCKEGEQTDDIWICGYHHEALIRGVVVQGRFFDDPVGNVQTIENTINQNGYHIILHNTLSGFIQLGKHLFFNRTLTEIHLLAVYELLDRKCDRVLCQRTWPQQSPDREIFQKELDQRVKEKQSRSTQHTWELFQDCWRSIPGGCFMKLVDRMPKVCQTLIKAKGSYVKESKIEVLNCINFLWSLNIYLHFLVPMTLLLFQNV